MLGRPFPQLLSGLDEIIVFHELNEEQLRQIVNSVVKNLAGHSAERKLELEMTDSVKSWSAKAGFDQLYGTRQLGRIVECYMENPLSTKRLRVGSTKEIRLSLSF